MFTWSEVEHNYDSGDDDDDDNNEDNDDNVSPGLR